VSALDLIVKSIGPESISAHVGRAYFALGRALQAQRKSDRARANFRLAAEFLEKALGPDHPETRIARQLAASSTQ
jgi:hypothetical protein